MNGFHGEGILLSMVSFELLMQMYICYPVNE